MTEDELEDELINDLRNAGIWIKRNDTLDIKATINVNKGIGAYNGQKATPFTLAHEYYHKMNNDCKRKSEYDARNPAESIADRQAVNMLWKIFEDYGGSEEYLTTFLRLSGVPYGLFESIYQNGRLDI
ncbi:MAG: hypothetical protein LBT37_06290 [Lactobacillaceae bacterium]|jgi:hypothetical protein|nr:hypothetical protein [Lactobacillaceae bacterium]